jgi:hypothetical protein
MVLEGMRTVEMCFPNMRDEKRERTSTREQMSKMAKGLLSPKPLGSIYKRGEEAHFCLIPLVG